MISRPDEQVLEGDIRKAGERTNNLKSAVGSVGKIAAGAAGLGAASMGAKGLSKILPFLSEYIPEDLAYKGINKVMPGVGTFLKDGIKQGLSLKSGLDFIKEQVSQSQQKEPAKQKGNIIEQESPELHQYIFDLIRQGEKPVKAGFFAATDRKYKSKFDKAIRNLEKTHKMSWGDIINSVYGSESQALPEQSGNSEQLQNPSGQQPQPSETTAQFARRNGIGYAKAAEIMQQQQQQGNQPQTGDEAIMAAFEKLMKM